MPWTEFGIDSVQVPSSQRGSLHDREIPAAGVATGRRRDCYAIALHRYTAGAKWLNAEACRMALDDREQKILEEIERNLYAEDPKLAQTVARADLSTRIRRRRILAGSGFFIGLAIMLGTFTRFSLLAGLGFILMVASAALIATTMRGVRAERTSSLSVANWMEDVRERWRRER